MDSSWRSRAKSSSPAPSPARSTRRRCRRICRSRPQEIAERAIGAAEAGAAIVHLHARNPQDGRPDQTPEAFAPFLKVIKQRSRRRGQHHHRRRADDDGRGARQAGRAPSSRRSRRLNMGTMNFGLYPMIPRYKGKFKHDWEEPYLEGSRKPACSRTPSPTSNTSSPPAPRTTRASRSSATTSAISTRCAHFLDRGLVKPPLFMQSVFGILGGIGAHPEDVIMMKRTADRLFGDNYHWSVLGAGRQPDAGRRAWRRRWAATCASAWRTRCGSAPASSPSRTRSR